MKAKINSALFGDKSGIDIIHDPRLNKGTAFTPEEREELGLRGLLPPRYVGIAAQLERVYENYGYKETDLEKYIHLIGLLDRNETLFYYLLERHLEEMMPIVYTPTVGLACQKYSRIFRRPRGLCISIDDQGEIDKLLMNWPYDDVRIIVVTDGERILGLGDLGLNGMGIPVGKLSLYVAAAGINPSHTLPIVLDVGTNNQSLLDDPLYLGMNQTRLTGPAYDEFIDEFMHAVNQRWPHCIIQFEDFGNKNAFRFLEKYRHELPTFNDDIQGTGAVTFAGLMGALRITKNTLAEQKIVALGAGEAGIGIAETIIVGMIEEGLTLEQARERFWFVDSQGLITKDRYAKLAPHKLPFARDEAPETDLAAIVKRVKPTMLLGVSGQPGTFTEKVVKSMLPHNNRPIIFALSNPTSKAECTAEQAYTWTDGKAIFASGSPFPPFNHKGQVHISGQGNNAYIFPGVGLGAIITGASRITDSMFYVAAKTLATEVKQDMLDQGSVYPTLSSLRAVSLKIAEAVALEVFRLGLATVPAPDDMAQAIEDYVWVAEYNYPR